jgi:hypothetical protein
MDGVGQAARVAEVSHDGRDATLTQCARGRLRSGQSQDLMLTGGQRVGCDRAKVAGGAGDENFHDLFLCSVKDESAWIPCLFFTGVGSSQSDTAWCAAASAATWAR